MCTAVYKTCLEYLFYVFNICITNELIYIAVTIIIPFFIHFIPLKVKLKLYCIKLFMDSISSIFFCLVNKINSINK